MCPLSFRKKTRDMAFRCVRCVWCAILSIKTNVKPDRHISMVDCENGLYPLMCYSCQSGKLLLISGPGDTCIILCLKIVFCDLGPKITMLITFKYYFTKKKVFYCFLRIFQPCGNQNCFMNFVDHNDILTICTATCLAIY